MKRLIFTFCLLLAFPAQAYVIVDVNGQEAHWPGEQLPSMLRVDPLGFSGDNGPECLAAVQRSMATWREAEGSYAGLVYAGDPGPEVNRGTIRFARTSVPSEVRGALAITLMLFNPNNGRILSAELIVDAKSHRWATDGRTSAYDLEAVVTHELGHYLGLDHTPEVQATLYHLVGVGETRKRSLHQDDLDGLRHLYPDDSGVKGAPCAADADCDDGICADNRLGQRVCARSCDPGAMRDTCLLGAECLEQGDGRAACLGGSDACRRCLVGLSECMAGVCLDLGERGYCTGHCDPDRPVCAAGALCRPHGDGWVCQPTDALCADAPEPGPLLRLAAGPFTPAAASVAMGSQGVNVFQLRAQNLSESGSIVLDRLVVRILSSQQGNSTVMRAALVLDADHDGAMGPGESELAAVDGPGAADSAVFEDLAQTLNAGQIEDLLLVVDLEDRAEQAGLPGVAALALLALGLLRRRRRAPGLALALLCLGLLAGAACDKQSRPPAVVEYVSFQVASGDDVGYTLDSGGEAELAGLPVESETLTVLLK